MLIEEAVKKFNTELPDEIRFSCSAPEVIKPLRSLESAYNINLAPLIIYFAIGEIKFEEVSEYIETEYQLDKNKVRTISKEIEEEILKPLVERVNFLNAHPDKDMSLVQEKNIAERMFQEHLRVELLRPSFITQAINFRLLAILSSDLDFQQVLVRAIYDNTEKITKHSIVVNEEPVEPTISNWLKDYISKYGTDKYDSMTQSTFLINSENGKKLDNKERALLAKVLKTYINIKFFPESMPTDDGEGWEIIPVDEAEVSDKIDISEDKTEETDYRNTMPVTKNTEFDIDTEIKESVLNNPVSQMPVKTKLNISKSDTPSEESHLVSEKKPLSINKEKINQAIPPPSVIKSFLTSSEPVTKKTLNPHTVEQSSEPLQPMSESVDSIQTTNESSDELLTLKNMLLQYPPDSLERHAIEEEIKKIESA